MVQASGQAADIPGSPWATVCEVQRLVWAELVELGARRFALLGALLAPEEGDRGRLRKASDPDALWELALHRWTGVQELWLQELEGWARFALKAQELWVRGWVLPLWGAEEAPAAETGARPSGANDPEHGSTRGTTAPARNRDQGPDRSPPAEPRSAPGGPASSA